MADMTGKSAGPQALDTTWLDETPSQVSGSGCGVADLFSWDGNGIDFAAEVESVSRLFPHLDGLPSELTGHGPLGVAEQAAICGGTRVALGAGGSHRPAGSPADPPPSSPGDQCLMSPSDALLASPDPSLAASPSRAELAAAGGWKLATGQLPLSEMVHIPAENTVADKITTLIEFVEPARAPATQPPPAEEIFVSPADLEIKQTPVIDTASSQNVSFTEMSTAAVAELAAASPVEITSPAAFETAAAAGSPVIEFAQSPAKSVAQSPAIDFLAVEEDDEHTRMIDQALEDLKTLESMCGITTSEDDTAAAASSASLAEILTSEVTAVQTTPTAPSSVTKPATVAGTVKQEPVPQEPVPQESVPQEEDDIEIVEERPAPRRRRRRPPRVAVTPVAAPATQIVIVLTSEQLAGIQKSGQIVLNAASLQPARAEAAADGGKTTAKAQKATGRAQNKAPAAGKAQNGRAQTAARGQSATVVKPTSAVTSTITSGASTSVSPGTSTSGAEAESRKAVKRPQVIVKQESAKRAKRTVKRPASSKDPLSGWMEQKLPPSGAGWDFPLLPAQALEQHLPLPEEGADGIPEDLQDVLLDGTDGAVPSLPADAAADGLFEELISGSVRLFDGVQPEVVAEEEMTKPAVCGAPAVPPVEEVLPQLPAVGGQPLLLPPAPAGYSLSPQPQQQLTLESWVPTLCPSPGEGPVSPASECSAPELAPAPDWRPSPASRRGARRPRPYDKQPASCSSSSSSSSSGRPGSAAARRQPLTEEERRERKKEQNKNAATRYRQKKKEEHDLVSGDQEMLEARNKVLRGRVGALSRELNYLKQLMREVLRHKQVTA